MFSATSRFNNWWVRAVGLAIALLAPILFFSTARMPWTTSNQKLLLIQNLTFPIQFAFANVHLISQSAWEQYVALRDVKKENIKLEGRVRQLEAELIGYKDLQAEVEKLAGLLDFKLKLGITTYAAQVVSQYHEAPFQMIRLATQKTDKLAIHDPVILPKGAVGRILRIGKNYVDVQLITDANSHIDVFVQRTRARGILSGMGTKYCRLQFQTFVDVKIGDEIIASGLLNDLPKGLPLGEVTKISFSPDNVSQTIIVKPKINFDDLTEVLIAPLDRTNVGFTREELEKL